MLLLLGRDIGHNNDMSPLLLQIPGGLLIASAIAAFCVYAVVTARARSPQTKCEGLGRSGSGRSLDRFLIQGARPWYIDLASRPSVLILRFWKGTAFLLFSGVGLGPGGGILLVKSLSEMRRPDAFDVLELGGMSVMCLLGMGCLLAGFVSLPRRTTVRIDDVNVAVSQSGFRMQDEWSATIASYRGIIGTFGPYGRQEIVLDHEDPTRCVTLASSNSPRWGRQDLLEYSRRLGLPVLGPSGEPHTLGDAG
jgi:hypothetical protein